MNPGFAYFLISLGAVAGALVMSVLAMGARADLESEISELRRQLRGRDEEHA